MIAALLIPLLGSLICVILAWNLHSEFIFLYLIPIIAAIVSYYYYKQYSIETKTVPIAFLTIIPIGMLIIQKERLGQDQDATRIWVISSVIAGIILFIIYCVEQGNKHQESSETNNQSTSRTSTQSTTSYTSSSSSSYSSSVANSTCSGPYKDLITGISLATLYVRFFDTVASMQEPHGSGDIMIRKNSDDSTMRVDGHYCNYESMDCSRRIGSSLLMPGFYVIGSSPDCRDSVNYTLEKVKYSDSEFGLQTILAILRSSLPQAVVTGQTARDDFCSVQFKT